MSTLALGNGGLTIPRWRPMVWRHPEWWAVLISGGSWAGLMMMGLGWGPFADPHAQHRVHAVGLSAWSAFGHWALMIPAMMYPLLIGHLRVAATRSLWKRRNRAIALFLVGYSAPWLSFGILAVPVADAMGSSACLAIAALWQLAPWKRVADLACHRTVPLAPSGFGADLGCLRYGALTFGNCWLTCWGVMLACAASHQSAWAMPALAFCQWFERMPRTDMDPYSRYRRGVQAATALAIASAAAYFSTP